MRNELQEEFNKVNILNKIWSPKVGYPSLKIDSFLSNLTVKTNDDLTNMWGANNLKIKDFKINASDFNIVVMKDGVEIKDASLCSESETQTINTAISFSIVESNIDNNGYDILRLDELDMSLDQERRLGFMDMIQHRIEEMGVDSCFIISHNNKFDDIPADVILMSDYKLEEEQAKNKNIIFRA
jgi:DNA repair exonuclease SbcCD ATPase subunit